MPKTIYARRSADGTAGRRLVGYPIVFYARSEDLGGFVEQIAPEAVDRTLREGLDVRALFNHDSGVVLGRSRARTLLLERDRRGLRATIDAPASAGALFESIRRGDISGMSFRFRALADAWDFEQDPPLRTVTDMRISEVSVVAFPAYSGTSIDLAERSARGGRESRVTMWTPSLRFRERLLRLDPAWRDWQAGAR